MQSVAQSWLAYRLTGSSFLPGLVGFALIQAMAPAHLRGCILAVYAMMFMGMAPFGALIAGALASRIGAPSRGRARGVAGIAGSLVFARAWAGQLVVAQGIRNPPCEPV